MILSASGWRKVFAVSGNEQDKSAEIGPENTAIAVFATESFAEYIIKKTGIATPVIACGIDSRPTGPAIADAVIRTLLSEKIIVQYTGITAAPEIMAYARKLDGFIYISASHNPIGHNGIKFGTNDGGVLNAQENAEVTKLFTAKCSDRLALQNAAAVLSSCGNSDADWVYAESAGCKKNAVAAYTAFIKETISAESDADAQSKLFNQIRISSDEKRIGVVCDMNGSARTLSIDNTFFTENGINFYAIHNKAGDIAHEIIPEAENLVYCAHAMEQLHKDGHNEIILGYMPDCDGDRGNIVYWNEKQQKADVLKAQEVFSLSVLAELAFSAWQNKDNRNYKPAVAVNGPTSMRINEIASSFGAEVFRAEVGEANVVNLAREKRAEGYTVRILGEGSNGGTITYPSAVRDPMNTVFAIIKLLTMKQLYKLWCEKAGAAYKENYTLTNILSTLPVYTTTGVSESRAILHVKATNHSVLKAGFQKVFEEEWKAESEKLAKKYGIISYEAVLTNGTKETRNASDFSKSGKGGLKILFYADKKNTNTLPCAFIWMRGSGTEPVFRVMCDVKGNNTEEEAYLLKWETEMLEKADGKQ